MGTLVELGEGIIVFSTLGLGLSFLKFLWELLMEGIEFPWTDDVTDPLISMVLFLGVIALMSILVVSMSTVMYLICSIYVLGVLIGAGMPFYILLYTDDIEVHMKERD